MDTYEALRTIQEAAGHWAEYLAENDRDGEAEDIDVAQDAVDELARLFAER